MKIVLSVILLSILTSTIYCQTSQSDAVWARVEALNKAIFETKDSGKIEELVSGQVTYGHSTGLIEAKPVMLHNAVASHEVYKNLSAERLGTVNAGQSVIVRYILRAEVLKEGNTSPLNIGIMQVWAKEGGKWKLFARQAVKVNPKE